MDLVGLPLDKFSSIYANINNWFIERNGLLSYMYPQLTAVIKKRYLSSPEFVTSLHAALPDYFQNKYRGSDRCVEAVWHCQYINDTERLLQQCADLDLMPFLFAESFRKEYIACCRKAGGYEAVMTQCLANLHAVAEAGKDREGDAEYRAEMWHRKHLVAQFGREGGLYQQAAPLLIDLSSNIPPGITTAEAVEVLLLLQELHWRYKVEPQGGESKAGAAVRLLKQALGMMQEAEDKNLLSQVYHGLGLVHLIFFRKEPEDDVKIKKYLEQALELRLETGDYAAAGDTMNGLGSLAQRQKDYPAAEEAFIRSLEMREKVLSSNDPDIAQVNTSLGSLYSDMQDYDKARHFYIRAKDIYARALGPEHPRGATALEGLGMVYKKMGANEDAKKVLGQVVEIHRKKGEQDPNFKRTNGQLEEVTAKLLTISED